MLWHTAHITFKDNVAQEKREEVYSLLSKLGEECGGHETGILFFRAGWNTYRRKGVDLVEIMLFRDEAAAEAFRVHPAHKSFGEVLRDVADWQIGDVPN